MKRRARRVAPFLLLFAGCTRNPPPPRPSANDVAVGSVEPRPLAVLPPEAVDGFVEPADPRVPPRALALVGHDAEIGDASTLGRMSVAWDGKQGLAVNCTDRVREDEVEGDKSITSCQLVDVDANGDPTGPWARHLPSDPWLKRFVKGWDPALLAKKTLAEVVTEQSDFNQLAVATQVEGVTPFITTEIDTTGAVGRCNISVSLLGRGKQEVEHLSSCLLWKPSTVTAHRGNRTVLVASGIDDATFQPLYEAYSDGSSKENPWVGAQRSRVLHRTGAGPWTAVPMTALGGEAVAVSGTHLAVAARTDESVPATAKKRPAPRRALRVVIQTFPPQGKPSWIDVAHGDIGVPAIALVGSDLLVVWAETSPAGKSTDLRGARVAPDGAVQALGSLGAGSAPSLVAAGKTLALAYADGGAPSSVRLACGATDIATLVHEARPVASRAREPVLDLAPDGSTGLLAWQDAPQAPTRKGALRAHLTTFRCTE